MYLQVTVILNLTSDLVFRIIMSGEYLLYIFEVGIPNLMCECILRWKSVLAPFLVTVILTSDLLFRICIKTGA